MYVYTRIAFVLLLLILFYIILHVKKAKIKKITHILSIVIACVLAIVLELIPFENFIYSFPSAEKAFCYYRNYDEEDIVFSVEGDYSKLLISDVANRGTWGIMTKQAKGWKIGTSLQITRIKSMLSSDVSIIIYKHKPTNDVYVHISSIYDAKLDIYDNRKTVFVPYKDDTTLLCYYGYIEEYSDDYEIAINGEKYSIVESDEGKTWDSSVSSPKDN